MTEIEKLAEECAREGEGEALCQRLEYWAPIVNRQPNGGLAETLFTAATRIRALAAENEALRRERDGWKAGHHFACGEAEARAESLERNLRAALERVGVLTKELAAQPCTTHGAEDLEPGCCASCRARTTLEGRDG